MKKHDLLSLLFTLIISLVTAGGLCAQDKLFLVFLNTNPDREVLPEAEVTELQKGHLANIGRLYSEGKLLLAGPFDSGGGIFVIKADNIDAVNKLLSTDPAISANRFLTDIYPMRIDKGMICEQDEPYEMIQYNFIMFSPENLEGDGNWRSKELYDDNEGVLFSIFLEDYSFVEILTGGADADDYAKNHPLVSNGQYSYNTIPWWSTNKTFCTDENRKLNYK